MQAGTRLEMKQQINYLFYLFDEFIQQTKQLKTIKFIIIK